MIIRMGRPSKEDEAIESQALPCLDLPSSRAFHILDFCLKASGHELNQRDFAYYQGRYTTAKAAKLQAALEVRLLLERDNRD